MSFTREQVDQLLKPIAGQRVLKDVKGHSHVSQQDVLAHLIRVFGVGNFDIAVLDVALVFEQPVPPYEDKHGKLVTDRWDVCYRALVGLTIKDPDGFQVAHYENGSTATGQHLPRGDAHDLAYKSAISLSVKRAAIALGDQFGLSLYNKGQTSALVIASLVMPEGEPEDGQDLQAGVPRQVSLGNDEIDHEEPTNGGRQGRPPTIQQAIARTVNNWATGSGGPINDSILQAADEALTDDDLRGAR